MPGIFSFQTTFFVSDHSEGRLVSLQMPSLVGPRHCGQLPAQAEAAGADDTGGQLLEGEEVGLLPLVALRQAAEVAEPGVRPLHHPARVPQAAAVGGAALGQQPGHQVVVDGARHVVHAIRSKLDQRVGVAGCGHTDRGPVGQRTGVAAHLVRPECVDAHHVEVIAVQQDTERSSADVAGRPLHYPVWRHAQP